MMRRPTGIACLTCYLGLVMGLLACSGYGKYFLENDKKSEQQSSSTNTTATCLCDISYFDIIKPENASALLSELQNQATKGGGTEAVSLVDISTTLPSPNMEYQGWVLAPNGKLYAAPYNNRKVLIYDPNSGGISQLATDTVLSGTSLYVGGVLASNGKIYFIPNRGADILVVNAADDTFYVLSSGFSSVAKKWQGAALAPNGKIYAVPYIDEDKVLVIDPATDTTALIATSTGTGTSKWQGAVLGTNGKIYGIPRGIDKVLVIDPFSGTNGSINLIDISSVWVTIAGTDKYSGGVLAPNGKIYAIPRDADKLLVIDPATDTVSVSTTVNAALAKWTRGALAPNGKIYGFPFSRDSILIIDPLNSDTVSEFDLTGYGLPYTTDQNWQGAIMHPNGKIYLTPYYSNNIFVFDPQANGSLYASILQSGYFNNF